MRRDYLDVVMFGRLVQGAMTIAGIGSTPQLTRLLYKVTGHHVEATVLDAVIRGQGGCDVATFRALVQALEPPSGARWFDPAFNPDDARHFWQVTDGDETPVR